tara:strand:+ start:1342 stop:1863 length:522 start_codon:yes stop_codon:yes gene_type:complete
MRQLLILVILILFSSNSYSQKENALIQDGLEKQEEGNLKGAIISYSKAIEINPKNFWVYSFRGSAKFDLNDFIGAILDYSKSISLNPTRTGCSDKGEIYSNRGLTKASLKDYRGALIDFSKAIELDNKNGQYYYNRGFSKRSLKNINGACLDWSKSGELGLSNAYNAIKDYCN